MGRSQERARTERPAPVPRESTHAGALAAALGFIRRVDRGPARRACASSALPATRTSKPFFLRMSDRNICSVLESSTTSTLLIGIIYSISNRRVLLHRL